MLPITNQLYAEALFCVHEKEKQQIHAANIERLQVLFYQSIYET